jgi:uncharacterized RDD family membrane protein YckC
VRALAEQEAKVVASVAADDGFRWQEISRDACAGFWIRVYATAVDFLLVFLVLIVIAKTVDPAPLAVAVVVAFSWFHLTLLESSSMQGTIGKSFRGLAVTNKSGRRIWY